MVALVVLVIVRWRRPFAWWEFAVLWALVGGAMAVGIGGAREAKRFGFEIGTSSCCSRRPRCSASWRCRPPSWPARRSPRSRSGPRWRRPGPRPGWPTRRWPFVILAARPAAARRSRRSGNGSDRDPVSQGLVAYVPGRGHRGRLRRDRRGRAAAQPAARDAAGGVGAGGRAGRGRVRHRRRADRAACCRSRCCSPSCRPWARSNPELLTGRFGADPGEAGRATWSIRCGS